MRESITHDPSPLFYYVSPNADITGSKTIAVRLNILITDFEIEDLGGGQYQNSYKCVAASPDPESIKAAKRLMEMTP